MARVFLGLLLSALLVAAAPVSARELEAFEEAGWAGVAIADDGSNAFTGCMIGASSSDGMLFFTLSAGSDFFVSVQSPAWRFNVGQSVRGRLEVGRYYFEGDGTADTADTATFIITATDDNYELFQRGNTLRVRIDGRSRSYSLRGSRRAMDRLVTCVATHLANAATVAAAANDRTDKRLEATTLLTNVLAGIAPAGFQVVEDPQMRKDFNEPDVLWGSNEYMGMVNILDTFANYSIDEVAALRGADMGECGAGVNIASKRDTVQGVSVFTSMIECRVEGQSPLYFTRILLPRKAGGYVEFGFVVIGNALQTPAVKAEQLTQALYREALK